MPAWAAPTQCPAYFAGGVAPTITNVKLKARTQEICFEAFAVLHSGLSRTALYSAEHLTRATLNAAKKLSRKDSYHREPSLPEQDRAELSDYARSSYDRGHLSPNADFATRSAQAESFSLANMVPQTHANNAGVWAGIESATRKLATSEGELYVVSGPVFLGADIEKVGRVLVPTQLWKVLYSPKQQRAGAYVSNNDTTGTYSTLTVSELEKIIGVSLLPGLSQNVRDAGMDLPKPSAQRSRKKKSKAIQEEFILQDFSRSIIETIKRTGQH